jgi:hypothetical protein
VDKDEVIEKNKTTIKENRAAIRQSLDKLDKLINTPKGRELMTVIRKLRDELDPKYEELVALARSDRAKAIEFLFKSMSWLSKLLWSGEQRPAGCDNAVSIGSGLSESVGSTFRPLIRSRRAEQTSRVPLVWSSHFCHSILLVSW